MKLKIAFALLPLTSMILALHISTQTLNVPDVHNLHEQYDRRIYIAMGVCLSKHAQEQTQKEILFHNHSSKPYDFASILSTALWKEQLLNIEVVIIASVPNLRMYEPELNLFRLGVEIAGGKVKTFQTSSFADADTACVRAAQLSRSFLFEFVSNLSDEDIVVTSDVDAFPINASDILSPLSGIPEKYQLWVSDFVFAKQRKVTIPMTFIGMQVKQWRSIWTRTRNMTLEKAIEISMEYSPHYSWGRDQLLTTSAIMNSGKCSLPPRHWIWKKNFSGLMMSRHTFIPEHQCFKGNDQGKQCHYLYENDNRCNWHHFYPNATISEMIHVYRKFAKVDKSKQLLEVLRV